MQLITWLQANYAEMLQVLLAFTMAMEMIVRLVIPTSSAEGFLERLGGGIQSLMDFLKVPVAMKTPSGVTLANPANAAVIADNNAAQAPPK